MATLEMVPLRSMYPNTGRMTLRYQMPRIDVGIDAVRTGFDIETVLGEVLGDEVTNDTTTPQVAGSESTDGETGAGKGGRAR